MKEQILITSKGHEEFSIPVFLPSGNKSKHLYFMAYIAGETQHYPFLLGRDSLTIEPSNNFPVFENLIQSEFEGKEWLLRSNTIHRKSKTMSK